MIIDVVVILSPTSCRHYLFSAVIGEAAKSVGRADVKVQLEARKCVGSGHVTCYTIQWLSLCPLTAPGGHELVLPLEAHVLLMAHIEHCFSV